MGHFILPQPRISLVGAGPGDPELLTLRGARVIAAANVILYDALVDDRLLEHASPEVPKIFVGKRCGRWAMPQEQINALLVESAKKFGHAVRLKGGDAFVFGRGGEEWQAARAAGIPIEVVPGVSSALAAPALAGIPLTHRGVSRGFWVLTATTSKHQLPEDMEAAARSNATVVVLMGTRKIAAIAELFARNRGVETPMALVQSGSLPEAKTTIATLGDPAALVDAARCHQPGILIIGDVVEALSKGITGNCTTLATGYC